MVRFVVRRLVLAIPTLLGVSIVVYALRLFTPGDPAQAIAGPYASAGVVNAIRIQYHLNEPIPVQYVHWLWNAVRGNLGVSPNLNASVGPIVLSSLLHTFLLVASALLVAVLVGSGLGLLAGMRSGSLIERTTMSGAVIAGNVPPYLLALLLVLVFAITLKWLPGGGMQNLVAPGGVPDVLEHLILPTIAIAVTPLMVIARMMRASVLEVSKQEYVLVARAVGVPPRQVTLRYIFWNALPPVVSVSGLQVGTLLSSALFAEVVFSWPGLGVLLYNAVLADDVLVIQAATLCIALTFVLANLLADVLVALISPQTRTVTV